MNTKSISTSTGIETAVPPLDTCAVTDYVNLGIHTLVASDCAYVVDVSVNAEVLDEDNNIWNQITVDDKLKFDEKTEQEMRDRAILSGLLEEAQESAEEIIVRLFTANKMISEQYSIECKSK